MVDLVITPGGSKVWFLNGEWHRANGPAVISVIYSDNTRWFWHGTELSEFEHMMLVAQEQTNG